MATMSNPKAPAPAPARASAVEQLKACRRATIRLAELARRGRSTTRAEASARGAYRNAFRSMTGRQPTAGELAAVFEDEEA